jgi:hypothetical protein
VDKRNLSFIHLTLPLLKNVLKLRRTFNLTGQKQQDTENLNGMAKGQSESSVTVVPNNHSMHPSLIFISSPYIPFSPSAHALDLAYSHAAKPLKCLRYTKIRHYASFSPSNYLEHFQEYHFENQ